MRAFGLQSHIWQNNLKSGILLAGFPILLCLLLYGICLLIVGMGYGGVMSDQAFVDAGRMFQQSWLFAMLTACLWFVIAMGFHHHIINAATGAEKLNRREAPEVYNLLENLCISRGMVMPRANVIETPALNAYASGLNDGDYAITVTRGLINELNEQELRAVIAHELTHIINKDVRLLIISVIFVGIFSFIGELAFRYMFRFGTRIGGYSSRRNGDSRGGGIIILIAVVLIAIAYVLGVLIRFSLSRKREFLADAGAVDLTRDPDSMISALRKISANATFNVPNDVAQMCIENTTPFAGIFSTHPSIDKRIEALKKFAGGW